MYSLEQDIWQNVRMTAFSCCQERHLLLRKKMKSLPNPLSQGTFSKAKQEGALPVHSRGSALLSEAQEHNPLPVDTNIFLLFCAAAKKTNKSPPRFVSFAPI